MMSCQKVQTLFRGKWEPARTLEQRSRMACAVIQEDTTKIFGLIKPNSPRLDVILPHGLIQSYLLLFPKTAIQLVS